MEWRTPSRADHGVQRGSAADGAKVPTLAVAEWQEGDERKAGVETVPTAARNCSEAAAFEKG